MRTSIPATFARGGTSKALIFRIEDLPADRSDWDELFLRAMGSPDPSERQLNGMGGGFSSVSKVCVVGPPTHTGADVDYIFAQVQVTEATVDYSGNCGNMVSAIGSFAIETGLVSPEDGEFSVRIHNVNTGKLIRATMTVADGQVVEEGAFRIAGVAGSGAPIRLEFQDAGGATTGKVLPAGAVRTMLDVESFGALEASLVDAANACVFVRAQDVGLIGTELPSQLSDRADVLSILEQIRRAASVAMGITADLTSASQIKLVPLVAVVSPPQQATTLSGEVIGADEMDMTIRVISNGQPHRAVPVTGALCTATAAKLAGSIPNEVSSPASAAPFRIGMPSGVLSLDAVVTDRNGDLEVDGVFFRTSRQLFRGEVSVS